MQLSAQCIDNLWRIIVQEVCQASQEPCGFKGPGGCIPFIWTITGEVVVWGALLSSAQAPVSRKTALIPGLHTHTAPTLMQELCMAPAIFMLD